MRWLVIGHGDVVIRHSVPALREIGAGILLWGRDPERAAGVAATLGVPARADLGPAMADADAVYVATPVATHVAYAEAAIAAGKPVLVEKPVSGALPIDATRLSAARTTVGCAYYRRLDPMLRHLRDEMRRGGPWTVTVDFAEDFRPAPGDPKFWRTEEQVSGGGVLADAGSHRVDLLCWLLGAPASVTATFAGRGPGGAERAAEVELTWADGSIARGRFDWSGPAVDRFQVTGATASFQAAALDGGVLAGAAGEVRRFAVPANRRIAMFADFEAALAAGTPPACPLEEALLVDRVLRAAARSSDAGAPVAL